jgi:serine/threonine protein kinase
MSRALGRYELLRPLARGGMAEVYLARRRAAGVEKWLVVKRMRPERAGDARFLDLFMREARLTMSLAHQNIVPVFDFGRIDDQVFLAMERIEGKDLGSSLTKSYLATQKGLPSLLAAFLAAECLQALDYAHRRKGPDGVDLGIVHRDVTPRNVLLSWAGEVKLTDFGIAVLAGDATSKGAGTPAYMAPEQARGEELDVRVDIYAVGLVLREALTGVRARKGNEKEGVLELAQRGELEPWPDGIDPRLQKIADRATAADRNARYADARQMLDSLDAYIVAERAANIGDSPTRQLAAWLAETWKDAREDEDNIDAKIDADVLVSFLDDGALDVIGTGTQRSALATADDEPPIPNDAPKVDSAKAAAPTDSTSGSIDAPIPPTPIAQRAGTEMMRETPGTSRTWLAIVVALALVAAIVFMLTRDRGTTAQTNRPPADASLDAAPEIVTPFVADAAVPLDAMIEATPDAGVKQTNVVRPRAQDAGVVEPLDAAVATKGARKVTINSKPTWSNWTVDGGPQHSGVETIELTPGKHTIHFTGNPYFKADKTVTIDVPDRDGFTHVETLEQL